MHPEASYSSKTSLFMTADVALKGPCNCMLYFISSKLISSIYHFSLSPIHLLSLGMGFGMISSCHLAVTCFSNVPMCMDSNVVYFGDTYVDIGFFISCCLMSLSEVVMFEHEIQDVTKGEIDLVRKEIMNGIMAICGATLTSKLNCNMKNYFISAYKVGLHGCNAIICYCPIEIPHGFLSSQGRS